MMDVVTIDIETYYDKEYSLTRMTTEAYIRDPRFEIIGVGVKVNDHPTDWYSGEDPGRFLKSLDYSKRAILCHNTAFDGAILSWHFGIKPRLWLDTMSMSRPFHRVTVGASLAKLAEHYQLGVKGTEVVNALRKRRKDFRPDELARYAAYCINDVDLTKALFDKLKVRFPVGELFVIDQILRMFIEPSIELDVSLLKQHLANVRADKEKLLAGIEVDAPDVMSNPKFAAALQRLGVTPPTKISPSTGKETWAFAKTDKGMTDLLEHFDDRVQALVAARLGVKSTLEETRTEAFIGIAGRGRLPIMLNYYGAHTGRLSGGDGMNLQNLPSRGNTTIRRALRAPEGHLLISCDSSQIEARIVAWLAGQYDLVDAFREGRDVYSEFASEVYGRRITKADKTERFVGKTCIAEGTLVLSHRGWKPIESVTTDDLLWDGQEWVCHQGLLNNGIRPTLNLCGAWLTPDHQVWSGTQWLEAQSVVADEDTLYQALDTGAENLPSQATLLASEAGSVPSWSGATATKPSTELTTRTSKISGALAVLCAPRKHRLQNAIGCTAKQWQTMTTGLACSIVSLQRSLGVTHPQTKRINIMESAEFAYTPGGGLTAPSSCSMSRLSMAGTTRLSRWIGSMWTAITNRGISASYRAAITSTINARLRTSKRVYDILNSGSRNRFTILTEAGPLVVHNCVLGLGYGMGAEKFRRTLEIGQGGVNVVLDPNEAGRIVRLYRTKNFRIAQLWTKCSSALTDMLYCGHGNIHDVLPYNGDGITLPSGFKIQYPALRQTASGFEYLTDARQYRRYKNGEVDGLIWVKIYGGKVVENVTQALAANVIREQMTAAGNAGMKVVLQVHDEIVVCVPEDNALADQARLEEIMSTPPRWAPDLPVACESGVADNYGDT